MRICKLQVTDFMALTRSFIIPYELQKRIVNKGHNSALENVTISLSVIENNARKTKQYAQPGFAKKYLSCVLVLGVANGTSKNVCLGKF